jgi:hypothetical protein
MSKWNTKAERRGSVRLVIAVKAHIDWHGGKFVALTTDLSPKGILVETKQALPKNTLVRVQFELAVGGETGRVVADGRVVRLVRSKRGKRVIRGLGIRFTNIMRGEDLLGEYVEGRLDRTDTLIIRFRERRTESRLAVGLPVRWGTTPDADQDGLLTSLSASGSFLLTGAGSVEADTRLYLTFDITADDELHHVRAVGRVVRATKGASGKTGLAIQFDVASMDIDAITWFVRQRTEGAKKK